MAEWEVGSVTSYGSVTSGIEAASVAWSSLGWEADWLAEIAPAPSKVLAHHYPKTPNLGDMTRVAAKVLAGAIAAPDVLVGGTPCQSFSVAGMRKGLSDARGALTLKFVELANAIDHVRADAGKPECVVVWENVPGVLSSRDNAFGCFLGALAGSGCELQPAGGKWTDAGCVYGPQRAVAWRVLDAQYFGLAQRRRRVFVVASARAGTDPGEILFEREGMRRDTPPRRGEGKDLAGRAPFGLALQCGCGHIFGRELGQYGCPNCEGEEGPAVSVIAGVPAFGGDQREALFKAGTLTAHGSRQDFASESFVMQPVASTLQTTCNDYSRADGFNMVCVTGDVTHALKAEGFDGSDDGTGRGHPIVAFHPTQDPICSTDGSTHAMGCGSTGGTATVAINQGMRVRRLTPRECERLQGFPDDYTLVPVGKKMMKDGPRYKAIGNSMAVYVMAWLGRRIDMHLNRNQEAA